MTERLRAVLPAVIGLILFAVALEVLRHELSAVTWETLDADLRGIPAWRLLAAFACTVASYTALTGYDLLAFRAIGKRLPPTRIVLASFLSYAVSNNVGFALLSGASVRYRFYTRWGVTAEELSGIVFSYSVTFWLGLLTLAGVSLRVTPLAGVYGLPGEQYVGPVAWMLIAVPCLYILATIVRREPLRIARWRVPLPSPAVAVAQLVVSCADWALAGAALYALLPAGTMPFTQFVGPFVAAILLGMASHVPGGLGVLEGLLVLLLKPYIGSADLLPRLVLYRLVYFLLPLLIALVALATDELRLHWARTTRLAGLAGRLATQITPRLFGVMAFVAGLILLVSGATPAASGRLEWLDRFLPLGVIEVSHFVGSVAGALLLILSQGLVRRLDAAYYLTSALLLAGIVASILKGLDYEEAALLSVILIGFLWARPAFTRRAAFFATRFSPAWVMSVLAAIGASVWLALFAFKHVDYSSGLWWQFELNSQASRALRGSVGAAMVALLFGVARLVRHAPPAFVQPSDTDLADAAAIIARQPSTWPNLVHLRDKTLLFNEARTAFLMYRVQGRSWVALGDPVGPHAAESELIRLFLELCDDNDGVPVFYEVGKTQLHRYADFGLTFVKIGEEAHVDLRHFTTEGPDGARYRKLIRRLEKDGGTFHVLPAGAGPAVLAELRRVSDDWLATRAASEKGFSLGFFDAAYVSQFPVAVVRVNGTIVAFATVWCGAGKQELSTDLMRFHRHAPRSTMEALFAHLLVWGQAEGYAWFSLGMAPLSGVEPSPASSTWNRIGAFVYHHGGSVYNFQGLRAFKEKFAPVWEPRYLVYPGGMNLPRLVADVAALVAGGYRQIFRR